MDWWIILISRYFVNSSGNIIISCRAGQVVLHAGQLDHPKYDCLFIIFWHFNSRVIFPRSPSGSLLKGWNQLRMLNEWANHSVHYQCLRLFSQRKVDRGWLVNVTWSRKFQSICLCLHPLRLHVLVFHK